MTTRRYSKAHWMKKKEEHLKRIMLEIQERVISGKSKNVSQAIQFVSRRAQKNPLQLRANRTYSPSVSTLTRHYAAWRKGPQFAKLYPRYRPGRQKAKDEVVPYLLDKLLNANMNIDAYAEIQAEWEAGFMIPGVGSLRARLMAGENKALPIDLSGLTSHRFSPEEHAEIQAIHKARREIERRSTKLKRDVCYRLGLDSGERREANEDE